MSRRDLFALAVLHATELHQQLEDLPGPERECCVTSYLADLRGEFAAQQRNGRASVELREIWEKALEAGAHSVRAEVRTLRRVK